MSMEQTILQELRQKGAFQALIDATAERYRPIVWKNFFGWKDVTDLKWESITGASGPGAAATVVSFDSAAPLRSRKSISKVSGEIPSIREKFRMTEKDLQEYLNISKLGATQERILKLIIDDIKNAAEAPHKRLDIFTLEALSTGQITLNTTNNPDGMVWETAIDYGMPSGNKKGVTAVWSDVANSKPITDITTICDLAAANGHKLEYMYMRRAMFNYLKNSAETKSYITGYAIGKAEQKVNLSLQLINEYLLAESMPQIRIVDVQIGIEKDGNVTNFNPFAEHRVAFTPAGLLGEMYNGPIVEREIPVKQVTYAEYDRVLLKKWHDIDPISEFTGCELNAFPAWNNVLSCYLLNTNNVNTYA